MSDRRTKVVRSSSSIPRSELAYQDLLNRVSTIPVPSAPPLYPSLGRSVGVGLLDAALNLNHVIHRTERLTIVDPSRLERSVTLGLSLDRLTSHQYDACTRMGQLRERPDPHGGDRDTEQVRAVPALDPNHPAAVADADDALLTLRERAAHPRLLWVPIARQTRLITSPTPIYDDEGRGVPRVTQAELLPLLNAAMYNLVRLSLPDPESDPSNHNALYTFIYRSNRARWLLQQAIADMIYFGSYAATSEPSHSLPKDLNQTGVERTSIRDLTCHIIGRYLNPDDRTAFLELLHHAASEYIVIAGLDPAKKEHTLSYPSPTLPAKPRANKEPTAPEAGGEASNQREEDPQRRRGRRRLRRRRPGNGEAESKESSERIRPYVRAVRAAWSQDGKYVVRYTTHLPRNMDSFHVVIESELGVRMQEAALTTNYDAPQVEELARRLAMLSEAVGHSSDPHVRSIRDYEQSAALIQLDRILARRDADARVYREHLRTHAVDPRHGEPNLAFKALLDGLGSSRDRLRVIPSVGEHPDGRLAGDDHVVAHSSGLGDTPAVLHEQPEAVSQLELDRDIVADGDPRPSFVHLFWRRRSTEDTSRDPGSFRAQVDVLLTDEPPPFTARVQFRLVTLMAIIVAIGLILFETDFLRVWTVPEAALGERGSVDALVAVLLVVPALLVARLDLPHTNNIAGLFRMRDRIAAWCAVVVSMLLGLILAAKLGEGYLVWFVRGALVAIGALVVWIELLAKRQERQRQISHPGCLGAPRWLVQNYENYRSPDAVFENERPLQVPATGEHDDAT